MNPNLGSRAESSTTPGSTNAKESSGPLGMMPPRLALRMLDCASPITCEAGELLTVQHHRADYFYFLLQGQLEFHIALESVGHEFPVGRTSTIWTPVGWSAFRGPHRYATSVRTASRCSLFRFSRERLEALFEDEPFIGRHFFEMVESGARQLLREARERLVLNLRESTLASYWAAGAVEGASDLPKREIRENLDSQVFRIESKIPSEESIVKNAAPSAREALRASAFFEPFSEAQIEQLVGCARTDYFCRGDLIRRQGVRSSDFMVMVDGRLRVEYRGTGGRAAVLGFLSDCGDVVGSGLLPSDAPGDVSVRATRDGACLSFDRQALEEMFEQDAEFGQLFRRRCLWLLARRLRGTRARLVSEEFAQEVLAVENLVEQARTELRVSSTLHKLPHLLKAPVTLVDALSVVDEARLSEDRVERHIGKLAHELLEPVRREQRFFSALQTTFEEVVSAPRDTSPRELRALCAENFVRVFSQIPYRVSGIENLPTQAGHIFVFNHLKNHECNTLPNGFQLTLDSHFISAMILHRAYGDPGVRVVRQSRAEEYGHHAYYERLGHISVYTQESDGPRASRSERFQKFLDTASAHLKEGTNLVLAPEGTSLATEESPGPFKAGAFRLAAALGDEPLIVPIAVAHFDRRLDHTTLGVVVKEPFYVTHRLKSPDDPRAMRKFLEDLQRDFRTWVQEAVALAE